MGRLQLAAGAFLALFGGMGFQVGLIRFRDGQPDLGVADVIIGLLLFALGIAKVRNS